MEGSQFFFWGLQPAELIARKTAQKTHNGFTAFPSLFERRGLGLSPLLRFFELFMRSTYKLTEINAKLGSGGARLVAVSKNRTPSEISDLYDAGQRVFGENRVQEMLEKQPLLPADIEWHQIGHLQRNKVRFIAPFVQLIHAVDSERLLQEIDRQASLHHRSIAYLLQVHVAQEDTKYGWAPEELIPWAQDQPWNKYTHTTCRGLMAMASLTESTAQIRAEFKQVRALFEELREAYFQGDPNFCELSMGMSGDWQIALEEGATLVRIGTALFEP